jgi:hypothetical protein
LAVLFSRRETSLNWSLLAGSAAKIALSTGAMALATIALSRNWPMPESLAGESAAVFVPIAVAVAVYGFAAWLIGCEELKMLASAMRRQ